MVAVLAPSIARGRRELYEMSVEFADRVMRATRAAGQVAAALYYLAVHADEKHLVRGISIQQIADDFKVTWQTAYRYVRQLRSLGELETVKRGRGKACSIYRVRLRSGS